MPFAALLVLALGLSLVGTLFNLPQHIAAAASSRPNIVMFYLDDYAPYPQRLWNDAETTPALARFTEQGLEFEHAVASTPMCGPSRANLLTGTYSHQNGVLSNDIRGYRPATALPRKLAGEGYRTAFIGKHINGLAKRYKTRKAMHRLSGGWNAFDVIWEDGGRYYDWRQYRKSGIRRYGGVGTDHSTYQAQKRAAQQIKSTPRNKPLFLVISLYDGHAPLTPMRRFRDDPRCRDAEPWAGPAFDEEDVSDKPAYVQGLPRIGSSGYDLRARCEQSLTVDWLVGKVNASLKAAGRLDDTLQILTADNGWLMGDHRIEGKTDAYSTPVPLYMRWPAVAGDDRRVIREPVSNIDYAKTFCALAGCSMPDSDGLSLVPLINGNRSRLDREYLYVEMLNGTGCHRKATFPRPNWSGVESTLGYSDTLWAYTLYRTGEEELYDISADPHRLRNLSDKAAHADVLQDMRRFQQEVWTSHDVRWCAKPR